MPGRVLWSVPGPELGGVWDAGALVSGLTGDSDAARLRRFKASLLLESSGSLSGSSAATALRCSRCNCAAWAALPSAGSVSTGVTAVAVGGTATDVWAA